VSLVSIIFVFDAWSFSRETCCSNLSCHHYLLFAFLLELLSQEEKDKVKVMMTDDVRMKFFFIHILPLPLQVYSLKEKEVKTTQETEHRE